MPKFMSCLRSTSFLPSEGRDNEASQQLLSIPGDNSRPVKADCIFCNVSLSKGFNVVYEDDHYIAFKDRTPGAMIHLLIIPRHHHVSTVLDLRSEHIPMLQTMKSLGLSLARTESHALSSTSSSSSPAKPTEPKMGFHIPPFSSVHHLHLHVLVPPYKLRGRFKYPERYHSDGRGKKWGWFVTINQAEYILSRGQTIGLGKSRFKNNELF